MSSKVLDAAVKIGRLAENSTIKSMGIEGNQIVSWIRKGKKLVVTPGTKELQTSIIDIKFKCEDQELAAEVVKAIVDGFGQHLKEQYRNEGEELISQINKAKDQYEENLKVVTEKHSRFRKESKLLWRGDDGVNPYSNSVMQIIEKRQKNNTKLFAIDAALKRVAEVRKNNEENADVMLLALQELLSDSNRVEQAYEAQRMRDMIMTNDSSSSDAYERDNIAKLEVELNGIRTTFGEDHPQAKLLRNQIAGLKKIAEEFRSKELAMKQRTREELSKLSVAPETKQQQLNNVIGALQEQMELLRIEDSMLDEEYKAQFANAQEIEGSILDYKVLAQELNNTSAFLKQLEEALAKFGLSPEIGQKKMNRLELSMIGEYAGPFSIRYVLVGALLGAVLFSGLAYLLEMVDRSFRSPDEIAAELAVPILAHVPLAQVTAADRKDDKIDLSIVSVHRSKSSQSEAYRGVRTGLYFNNRSGEHKVIQVTSPVPGDGKSTTAANLAVTMAQSGRKTLLLDADFRRPRVSKLFGTRDDVGMASVISGSMELVDAIQATTVENLSVLACGKRPNNPAELLSSERFEELVQMLREKFDYVIIDSPPLLAVSDPAIVAARCDGVVVTLRLRRNLKPLAHRAVQMLRSVNAHVIGVVVNGVEGQGGYGAGGYRYGSSYGYGYGRYGYGYGQNQQYGYGYGYGGTYGYGYGGSYGVRSYYEDDRKEKKAARSKPTTKPIEKSPPKG